MRSARTCRSLRIRSSQGVSTITFRFCSIHIFSFLERCLRLYFTGSGKVWSWWSVFDVCKIYYIISFALKTYENFIISIIFHSHFYLPHKSAYKGINYRPKTFKKKYYNSLNYRTKLRHIISFYSRINLAQSVFDSQNILMFKIKCLKVFLQRNCIKSISTFKLIK